MFKIDFNDVSTSIAYEITKGREVVTCNDGFYFSLDKVSDKEGMKLSFVSGPEELLCPYTPSPYSCDHDCLDSIYVCVPNKVIKEIVTKHYGIAKVTSSYKIDVPKSTKGFNSAIKLPAFWYRPGAILCADQFVMVVQKSLPDCYKLTLNDKQVSGLTLYAKRFDKLFEKQFNLYVSHELASNIIRAHGGILRCVNQ